VRNGESNTGKNTVINPDRNCQGLEVDLVAKNELEDFVKLIAAFEELH
jgi:hypothetical protein